MLSVSGRIINKQIKLAKQMLPDTKRIILAHMNVKLCKGLDSFATSWALQRLPKSSLCGAWEAVLLDTWACREFFFYERFSLDNLWRCAGIAVSKRIINSWCVCVQRALVFSSFPRREMTSKNDLWRFRFARSTYLSAQFFPPQPSTEPSRSRCFITGGQRFWSTSPLGVFYALWAGSHHVGLPNFKCLYSFIHSRDIESGRWNVYNTSRGLSHAHFMGKFYIRMFGFKAAALRRWRH